MINSERRRLILDRGEKNKWPGRELTPEMIQANLRREIEIRDERIEELEAKLNEAMGLALNQCPFEYGTQGYNDWWQDRYKRLAQLEGDEDG